MTSKYVGYMLLGVLAGFAIASALTHATNPTETA